jgi:hypothetical protein
MIHITDLGGRIGPFWWVNACTSVTTLTGATWNGSEHHVWRPGVSGWGDPSRGRLVWKIIP